MKRCGKKKAHIGCTQGGVCNTNDVFRPKKWSDIGGPSKEKQEKNNVFCDFTSEVPHTVWAGLGCFFGEKCDSEHSTPQQQSEENKQLSAVHKDNFATQATALGQKCGEKSEARANKKQEKTAFCVIPQIRYRPQSGLFF